MREFPKPKIYSSKCLGFCRCWWNGTVIFSEFIESIKPFVEFVTHCPEVEIGLAAPRNFLRIVMVEDERRFVQPATGKDFTQEINDYTKKTVSDLPWIDGFVLRENSPSCSIKGIKYYGGKEKGASVAGSGPGLFGEAIKEQFPGVAIESDGRLKNRWIREEFLTGVFLTASFREVMNSGEVNALVQFQSRNKYLLMTYGQKHANALGRIVAKQAERSLDAVVSDYLEKLRTAIADGPSRPSAVNVLSKIYGYFSKKLTDSERRRFLNQLENYRTGKATLTLVRELLRMWVLRFENEYLQSQTFFDPFPKDLDIICEMEQYEKEMKR